jgi:lipopolysaccharide transport system permease protein
MARWPVVDATPPEVRYDAHAELRRPLGFAGDLLASIVASREVAWRLLVRDLRAQYRQTVLGYLWIVLPAVVTTFVWVYLNNANVLNTGDTDVPYPIFVLIGTLLWQGFGEAVASPLKQLSNATNLLTKVNFPREALFLAGAGDTVLNAFVRMLVVIPVYVWYGVTPGWELVLFPLGFLTLLLFGFGLGLWAAPIGVLYHDVQRLIPVVLALWFLVTPIVYEVPKDWAGRWMGGINPATPLITTTREWMTGGSPAVGGFLVMVVVSVVLVVTGTAFARLSFPHLVDRLPG